MKGKKSILLEAQEIIHGDRNDDYGSPLANHSKTASLWSAYLGVQVTPEDVCILNILQKISRSCHKMKRDNLVDIAGYAGNIEMIQEERASQANGVLHGLGKHLERDARDRSVGHEKTPARDTEPDVPW